MRPLLRLPNVESIIICDIEQCILRLQLLTVEIYFLRFGIGTNNKLGTFPGILTDSIPKHLLPNFTSHVLKNSSQTFQQLSLSVVCTN